MNLATLLRVFPLSLLVQAYPACGVIAEPLQTDPGAGTGILLTGNRDRAGGFSEHPPPGPQGCPRQSVQPCSFSRASSAPPGQPRPHLRGGRRGPCLPFTPVSPIPSLFYPQSARDEISLDGLNCPPRRSIKPRAGPDQHKGEATQQTNKLTQNKRAPPRLPGPAPAPTGQPAVESARERPETGRAPRGNSSP